MTFYGRFSLHYFSNCNHAYKQSEQGMEQTSFNFSACLTLSTPYFWSPSYTVSGSLVLLLLSSLHQVISPMWDNQQRHDACLIELLCNARCYSGSESWAYIRYISSLLGYSPWKKIVEGWYFFVIKHWSIIAQYFIAACEFFIAFFYLLASLHLNF